MFAQTICGFEIDSEYKWLLRRNDEEIDGFNFGSEFIGPGRHARFSGRTHTSLIDRSLDAKLARLQSSQEEPASALSPPGKKARRSELEALASMRLIDVRRAIISKEEPGQQER